MKEKQLYIFVGNGSEISAIKAGKYASKHSIKFNGILDKDTIVETGSYHTSLYDFNLIELLDFVKENKPKIISLCDNKYVNDDDYLRTEFFLVDCKQYTSVEYINENYGYGFINLLQENKSICIMPWAGFHQIGPNIVSCCHFNQKIKIDNEKIKQQMIADKKPEICNYCYDLENGNAVSPRLIMSAKHSQTLGVKNLKDLQNVKEKIHFDLRLDNRCNLMCRTCDPNWSSLIEKEYNKLAIRKSIKINLYSAKYTEDQLKTGKFFYFAGGEPLWHPDFTKTLLQMQKLKLHNAEIKINTNAAKVTEKNYNLLKNFTNLEFVVSIDGNDLTNKYIRWPNNWQTFVKNINKLLEIKNAKIMFACVVSIYNISHLYSIFKWIQDTYPKSFLQITLLTKPIFQQARYFPNKNIIFQELKKIKTLSFYIKDQQFKSRIDHLETLVSAQNFSQEIIQEFFEFNDKLDKSRNCLLKDYIPELEECRKLI